MQINDRISISKKTLFVISPVIGISVVLIAKDKAPEVLLFLIGVFAGVLIGKHFFGQKETKPDED